MTTTTTETVPCRVCTSDIPLADILPAQVVWKIITDGNRVPVSGACPGCVTVPREKQSLPLVRAERSGRCWICHRTMDAGEMMTVTPDDTGRSWYSHEGCSCRQPYRVPELPARR